MTPFVQLPDAGVIWCFKADYHHAFCQRAIKQDEAGEDEIHKINQLEIMLLVKAAWDAIMLETIVNCWRHAFQLDWERPSMNIDTPIAQPLPSSPIQNPEA
ncbi:hypothetical protein WOLCODRAFT_156023 [Wolfiporia cocos MD-104 SS10]|uniref:DDE-1 domain-containing protein n=1 Tax=Wolfiporia cocos (strain MD-104) TaxID=742152 RepID=A0A2H3IZB0_WOLCO|nr:hypothetical protein WOLCODRAFT_156023 [Wolfiporia cocos MD-104 SS10]